MSKASRISSKSRESLEENLLNFCLQRFLLAVYSGGYFAPALLYLANSFADRINRSL
jgi:hypothetical protein